MTQRTGSGGLAARAGVAAADAGGVLLAAATRAIAAVRPAQKPLHPVGEVLSARLVRHGAVTGSGVPWLDEPGEDQVLVRLSRAIGLPRALPDIHGLALRVLTPGRGGDLLLATTGWSQVGRMMLFPSRTATSSPLTSLLPYRTPLGPVVVGAQASAPGTYELSWAPYAGDWQVFGTLALGPRTDREIAFDPVQNILPGLEQYPVVTRLRGRAYVRARQSRTR